MCPPVDGEAFTERDDLVLTELARQVGLALHNVQLDAAVQASLEELQLTNTELFIPEPGSWLPGTPSAASSSATSTTVPNSTSWRSR